MMLLDINPPSSTIDQFWIRQTEEIIAFRVKSIQDTLVTETKKFADIQKSIRSTGVGLKDIVTAHHKLMTDVALLLRTIQKIDNFEFAALNTFLGRYKDFSEHLSLVIKVLLSEDISADGGRVVIDRLDFIKEETNFIYEELINIAAVARDETLVQVVHRFKYLIIIHNLYFQEMFKTLVREDDSTTNTNSLQSKKDGGQRQFSEEKNKFALSVLRRVRVKLEGREPDSLRKVRIVF